MDVTTGTLNYAVPPGIDPTPVPIGGDLVRPDQQRLHPQPACQGLMTALPLQVDVTPRKPGVVVRGRSIHHRPGEAERLTPRNVQ